MQTSVLNTDPLRVISGPIITFVLEVTCFIQFRHLVLFLRSYKEVALIYSDFTLVKVSVNECFGYFKNSVMNCCLQENGRFTFPMQLDMSPYSEKVCIQIVLSINVVYKQRVLNINVVL